VGCHHPTGELPIANRCQNTTLFTITNKLFTATDGLFNITDELFNRTNRLSGVSDVLSESAVRVDGMPDVLSEESIPTGKETTGLCLSVILQQCQ
jgi:hypothetical protein